MLINPQFPLGKGFAYHGTDAASARAVSGMRVGRPNVAPSLQLGLDTEGMGSTERFTYPRLFGPGFYVTGDPQHATGYAEDHPTGAVIVGELDAKSPISMSLADMDERADDPRIQKVSRQFTRTRPHLAMPMPAPLHEGYNWSDGLDKILNAPNYEELHPDFKKHLSGYRDSGEYHQMPAFSPSGRVITGADRAAVNIALRSEGHDFLHVPALKRLDGSDFYKDSGAVLNRRAYRPVNVHFLEGSKR